MSNEEVSKIVRRAHDWGLWLVEHLRTTWESSLYLNDDLSEKEDWARCIIGLLGVFRDLNRGRLWLPIPKSLEEIVLAVRPKTALDVAQESIASVAPAFAAVRNEPFVLKERSYASAHEAVRGLGKRLRHHVQPMDRIWQVVLSHLPDDWDFDGRDGYNDYLLGDVVECALLQIPPKPDNRESMDTMCRGLYQAVANDPRFAAEVQKLRDTPAENPGVWVGLSAVHVTKKQPRTMRAEVLSKYEDIDFSGLEATLKIECAKALAAVASVVVPPKARRAGLPEDGGLGEEMEICYIDMDQAAALVNRSKKTLERALRQGRMPPPDVEGGGGKKHEWNYAKLRPWLEDNFGRRLPELPPHTVR